MARIGDEALHFGFGRATFGERGGNRLDRGVVRMREFVVRAAFAGDDRARREVALRQTPQRQRGVVERPQRGAADAAHVQPQNRSAESEHEPQSEPDGAHDAQNRLGLGKDRDDAARDAGPVDGFAGQRAEENADRVGAPQAGRTISVGRSPIGAA